MTAVDARFDDLCANCPHSRYMHYFEADRRRIADGQSPNGFAWMCDLCECVQFRDRKQYQQVQIDRPTPPVVD